MLYTHFHFHCNFWYAEYTHAQTINQFLRLYQKIEDIFKDHPDATSGFDMDVSLTLPTLQQWQPSFINDVDELIARERQEVVVGTYSNAITTLMTRPEFDMQLGLERGALEDAFNHIAMCYFSQDGAYSPNLPRILAENGIKYTMIHQNVLNRFDPVHTLKERFRPFFIEGHDGTKLPAVTHAFEGIISSSDHETFLTKLKERLVNDPEIEGTDVLCFNFFDMERVDPEKLARWIEHLDNLGFKYMLPEIFLHDNPPERTLYFEDTDWHETEFHNEVDPDQRLYTEVERVRKKIVETEFWMDRAKQAKIAELDAFEDDMHAAKLELLNATSSDKSHWFSCEYKVKIGQQKVMNALERVDRLSGIVSERVADATGIRGPVSFMRHADHHVKLVNTWDDAIMPEFPIHVPYPFIFQASLNSFPDPGVRLDDQNVATFQSDCVIPTEPGVNYYPEVVFQPCMELRHGDVKDLVISKNAGNRTDNISCPADVFRSKIDKDTFELGNGHVKAVVKDGCVQELDNLDSNVHITADNSPVIQSLLKNTTSGFKYLGASDVDARYDIDADDESSLHKGVTFVMTKEPHIVEMNWFRAYNDFPAIEIDKLAVIQGKLVGDYMPFHLNLGFRPASITRELLGEDLTRIIPPESKDVFPRINDWALLENDDAGFMIAGYSQIRAAKFLPINKDGTADYGLVRGYPAYLPVNLLGGIYQYRVLIAPYASKERASMQRLAKLFRYQPHAIWWL